MHCAATLLLFSLNMEKRERKYFVICFSLCRNGWGILVYAIVTVLRARSGNVFALPDAAVCKFYWCFMDDQRGLTQKFIMLTHDQSIYAVNLNAFWKQVWARMPCCRCP